MQHEEHVSQICLVWRLVGNIKASITKSLYCAVNLEVVQ